ncbi:MAG: peptide chain release factor N(5)-glutamine methyltransferase, partial [Bacillota bacterium]|nr:peptide chain release factor N(5)-glutamine methyltransferase [Bacillota bacterium]
LIPRPDTEILVESVLERIDNMNKDRIDVLDIGAGSGAVAISIDLLSGKSNVLSVDISLEALEVANLNNKRLNANVEFVLSDVFGNVEGTFDVIVSNPPYIEKAEYETLDKNVKDFEPTLALKAENGGLFFYEKTIEESFDYLKKGGILAFEVGYNQSAVIMQLMAEKGYENISVIQDLSGINRVVLGYRGEKNV